MSVVVCSGLTAAALVKSRLIQYEFSIWDLFGMKQKWLVELLAAPAAAEEIFVLLLRESYSFFWGSFFLLWSWVSGRVFLVLFAVHQLGNDFPFMSGGIVPVGVLLSLAFRPLLARASTVHGFVLIKVVMLVLVKVAFRHVVAVSCFQSFYG